MKFSKKIISLAMAVSMLTCSVSAMSFEVSAVDSTTSKAVSSTKDTFAISKSTITLGVGESYTLTTNAKQGEPVLWGTSNTTIATAPKGKITAKKAGKVTIIAKNQDGTIAKCNVVVKEAPTSISLNKTSLTLGIGETYDLNSSLPSGCGAHSIVYSTDDVGVASVKSAGGLVTANSVGTAVITATAYNGKKVSCTVTVKQAPTSISLNKTSLTLGVGETYDLNSSLPNGCGAHSIVYSTDDVGVASVKSAGGLVTANSVGTAIITATAYNGVQVSCFVTVKYAPTSISLNKKSLTLEVGKTFDLNSSLPSGCGSYSIVYSSDNKSVASVKSAGGLVKANSVGTAKVTATAYNGKKVSCDVTVKEKGALASSSTNASYTDDDLFCLAAVIWQEAGALYSTDEMQLMVANVVMNHVKSPYFPNTIREVITRRGAYGTMYWDGVSIPTANDPYTKAAIDRCYANAKKILEGYRLLPDNVIYQAGFVQGSGIYAYEGGIYFCYA